MVRLDEFIMVAIGDHYLRSVNSSELFGAVIWLGFLHGIHRFVQCAERFGRRG